MCKNKISKIWSWEAVRRADIPRSSAVLKHPLDMVFFVIEETLPYSNHEQNSWIDIIDVRSAKSRVWSGLDAEIPIIFNLKFPKLSVRDVLLRPGFDGSDGSEQSVKSIKLL